jgi:O-antigen/teichoic acid export membrane protein
MSIKKNIFYNGLLSALSMMFPIVTAPYISRVLGVENMGLLNFVSDYAGYFVPFAALGVNFYGMREIAKSKNDPEKASQIFSEIFRINILSTVIVSVVYCASILLVPQLRQDWTLFILAGVVLYLTPIAIDWYFRGLENFRAITLRSFIVRCITLIGLFVFVRHREDVIPYILLCMVSVIGANIWNLIYAKKQGLRIKWRNLNVKTHLKPMSVFFVSNITISLYTMLNTLLLGFLSDYTQVGYFSSAYKIIYIVLTVIGVMSPVIMARVSIMKGESNNDEEITKLYSRSLMIMLIMAIPATIGLIVISPRFIPFFFGMDYLPSILPMQLLSMLVLIIGVSNFFGIQILLGLGYEKKFLRCVLYGAMSCIVLNLLLIEKFGAIGTSIAIVVAEMVVAIAVMVCALKIVAVRIHCRDIIQPLLASLPIILIALLFNRLIAQNWGYLSVTILLGGLIYLGIMLYVFKNEIFRQLLFLVTNKIKSFIS